MTDRSEIIKILRRFKKGNKEKQGKIRNEMRKWERQKYQEIRRGGAHRDEVNLLRSEHCDSAARQAR